MQKTKSTISIRWKLLAFLLAFVILILGIIWLFQIKLLPFFYQKTKYRELETISEIIGDYVGTDSLDAAVYSCAVDYSTCIRIFRHGPSNVAVEVASADVSKDCLIHDLSQSALNRYYQSAKQNGGVYSETKEMDPKLGAFWTSSDPRTTHLIDLIRSDSKTVGIVYAVLVESDDGVEYTVILNAKLTPVDATVNTLKTQFWWILAVLLLGALILAFLISKNISRPIEKMSRSAKKLAEGRYDVTFDGTGYKEAHELADSLNYASGELSRTDELQRELIANVSHDLRTPLTMIKGYTEVMRDIPGENTPENLNVIAEEADHLGNLVNDMLDLSRIRSGTRQPQMETVCLTEAVKEVLKRYEALVKNDGYEIEFVAEDEAWIIADRVMILQVVYNLVNNAIHYAGEDKKIIIKQTVTRELVYITVIDHGAGIAPEQLNRIWER